MIDAKIKVGDKVFWVHCSGRVYAGTVEELRLCEYQGSVYANLYSPTFKLNTYPTVHYSHLFSTKEKAKDFAKYVKQASTVPMCEGCRYHFKEDAT